jgi:hypothetical protein
MTQSTIARPAARIQDGLPCSDVRQVEEVADAGERLDGLCRHGVQSDSRVAEPLGKPAPGFIVELVLGLECHLLGHRLDPRLELAGVEVACVLCRHRGDQ